MEYTINLRGQLMDLSQPQVMGILNVTPDSFYAGSRTQTEYEIAQRAHQIVEEGGSIIDVGGYSTRPGASEVSETEEMERLRFALAMIRKALPSVAISVDTFRPDVARMTVEEFGADIINDVSEGDVEMYRMVARLRVPYILMSQQPTIRDMLLSFAKSTAVARFWSEGYHSRSWFWLWQDTAAELSGDERAREIVDDGIAISGWYLS